ncbi:hypothetical protein [Brucella tritici]|uniref:hypothetical protein n=1 Tax=Brucella tritici TaxID=94626 RepID=UPI003D6CCD68
MAVDIVQMRVIIGAALTAAFIVAGGSAIYLKHKDDQLRAEQSEKDAIARCEETIKRTNKYSLVLTDDNVRHGLECSWMYPQFKWFKELFDELSPNSPTRKPDN